MTNGIARVEGAEDFAKLAEKMRRAERARIRRALTKGLRDIARPVGEAMVRTGSDAMPRRGGLRDRVARSRVAQTNKLTGSNPSVTIRLRTREGYDLPAMNRGELRHRVFGKGPWVRQSVPAGAFEAGFNEEAPKVREPLARELDRVVREIGAGS